VECWDTGYGIHPDIETSLFKPFISLKEDGRGLGLYIVQELMSILSGEVYLSKERKNGRLYKFILKFGDTLEE
jgi:nitrogen-specific signal transduction histidine kinase